MYSSNPSDYEKYSSAPPPPQPSVQAHGVPSAGIPLNSGSDVYTNSQAPVHQVIKPKTQVPWSSGLFDCFSDCNNCCLTFWCPCITFGRIAEIVDKGSSSCGASGALYTLIACVTGCPCFYTCFYRSKMRQQYGLHESPCGDCLVHCCCEACALCQEYRELEFRGFDMSIGWHGNVERQNRGVAMAPIAPEVQGGMTR